MRKAFPAWPLRLLQFLTVGVVRVLAALFLPISIAVYCLLAGSALALYATFLLAGLPWAILLGGLWMLVVGAILLRGAING